MRNIHCLVKNYKLQNQEIKINYKPYKLKVTSPKNSKLQFLKIENFRTIIFWKIHRNGVKGMKIMWSLNRQKKIKKSIFN